MSTQKCECSGGRIGPISFAVFLVLGLIISGKLTQISAKLTHIAEWHKRDGIQRGFAVVKPDEDGSGDVHVEWKPLDTKGAVK